MKLNHILVILFIGIVLSIIIFNMNQNKKTINLHKQNYYAYGDSIVYGSKTDTCYMKELDMYHNISGNISFSVDGSSKTTEWAVNNFESHLEGKQNYIVFENFGFGDLYHNINPRITAENKLMMYNMSKQFGIKNYFVCIQIRTNTIYEKEMLYIYAVEDLLTENDVPFIRFYDAVDSKPFNNHFDGYDDTCFVDGVHPNEKGHEKIAEYIWVWLKTNKDKIRG